MMRLFAAQRLGLLVLALLATLSLLGADGDQSRFIRIGHQMICMCGCNEILLECNHVGCQSSDKMRRQVMAGIERGDSDNQIQQSFAKEYGLTVFAAPLNSGFGRLAWITPFAVFFGALLLTAFVVRAWRLRPAAVHSRDADVPSPELLSFREQARKETEL